MENIEDDIGNKLMLKWMETKDGEVFAEIYKLYNKYVYKILHLKKVNHNDIEDIVQDVFMILLEFKSNLKTTYRFRKLLYLITYNNFIDKFRRYKLYKDFIKKETENKKEDTIDNIKEYEEYEENEYNILKINETFEKIEEANQKILIDYYIKHKTLLEISKEYKQKYFNVWNSLKKAENEFFKAYQNPYYRSKTSTPKFTKIKTHNYKYIHLIPPSKRYQYNRYKMMFNHKKGQNIPIYNTIKEAIEARNIKILKEKAYHSELILDMVRKD